MAAQKETPEEELFILSKKKIIFFYTFIFNPSTFCFDIGSTVFSEDVLEKLVLILANLFGRQHLPACSMKYKRTFCQSKVEKALVFTVTYVVYHFNELVSFCQLD